MHEFIVPNSFNKNGAPEHTENTEKEKNDSVLSVCSVVKNAL
jgi:hypothetical protein